MDENKKNNSSIHDRGSLCYVEPIFVNSLLEKTPRSQNIYVFTWMYVGVWIYLSLKQGVTLLLCLHWVCDDDPGPHSNDVEKWGCLGSEPRCTGGDMSNANWWLLCFKPNARWRPYQKCSGLQGFGALDGLVWKLRKTPVDLCRTD